MATIYILKSADGTFTECYIGKTAKRLNQRLSGHKYDAKARQGKTGALAPVSSAQLFAKGDVIIEALEVDIPLDNVNERERYHMENTPFCINIRKSYNDPKEAVHAFNNSDHRKEYMKKYAEEHKEAVALAKKKYKQKLMDERKAAIERSLSSTTDSA